MSGINNRGERDFVPSTNSDELARESSMADEARRYVAPPDERICRFCDKPEGEQGCRNEGPCVGNHYKSMGCDPYRSKPLSENANLRLRIDHLERTRAVATDLAMERLKEVEGLQKALEASHEIIRAYEDARLAGTIPDWVRPEVRAFAVLMEQQLRANDHKPGWKEDAPDVLAKRVREEATELEDVSFEAALHSPVPPAVQQRIAEEAADVANMAMMVADVCGCLGEKAVKSCENSALSWEARAMMAEQFMARYASNEDVPKLLGGYEVQPIVRQLATLLLEAQEAALKGEKA